MNIYRTVCPLAALGFVAFASVAAAQTPNWAFEETFDGLDPAAPSQDLLPRTFDYVVTHRTHPRNHEPAFVPYPADHGTDCAGPAPPTPAQHMVTTSHRGTGAAPDEGFFVCKNHMMSAMGDVEGYSVMAFWPRQEFDFSGGGVIEVDVNINDNHPRVWWEILLTPREGVNVGAAQDWLPIDETYPAERIVLTFSANSKRKIQVGTGASPPAGWTVDASDWRNWAFIDPADPALTDRRIRRKMRIELSDSEIIWSVEKADGTFDAFTTDLPGGLPFDRGLVVFKHHAYTPEKDDNYDQYTFHWKNIRFSGPVVGRYEAIETPELVYLQNNGSRPIGDTATATLDLPRIGPNPVLFGQVHSPMTGQVLLSVNGRPDQVVHPHTYSTPGCQSSGWSSFSVPLDPAWLTEGTNTFLWTIGPRADCVVDWTWDGFSIKGMEMQFDLPESGLPFADGFESGGTAGWSAAVP